MKYFHLWRIVLSYQYAPLDDSKRRIEILVAAMSPQEAIEVAMKQADYWGDATIEGSPEGAKVMIINLSLEAWEVYVNIEGL